MDKPQEGAILVNYLGVFFINAQADLGVKILLQNSLFKIYSETDLLLYTALLNGLFLLPFVIFSPIAGYLSDQVSKLKVTYGIAIIGFLLLIALTVVFAVGGWEGALVLAFFLALQSAIYSPAKYGLIRELFGEKRVLKVNSLVQTLTIIAILGGTLFYGTLFELVEKGKRLEELLRSVTPIFAILLLLGIVEIYFARRLIKLNRFFIEKREKKIDLSVSNCQSSTLDFPLSCIPKSGKFSNSQLERESVTKNKIYSNSREKKGKFTAKNTSVSVSVDQSQPDSKFSLSAYLPTIGAIALFWGVSQLVVASIGEFIKTQLQIGNSAIPQVVIAISGIGLIIGAILVGKLDQKAFQFIPGGAIGMGLSLLLIPQLHSLPPLLLVTFFYGIGAGFYLIPLNAHLQTTVPLSHLGRVLGVSNQIQYLVMLGGLGIVVFYALAGYHADSLFTSAGIGMLGIGGIYLFPYRHRIVKLLFRPFLIPFYPLKLVGRENLPKTGGVLLLGNHQSKIDWLVLQLLLPNHIHFVIDRSYWNRPYLRPFLKIYGAIPISIRGAKEGLKEVRTALTAGKWVVLFPEGHLTRTGTISEIRRGYLKIVEGLEEVQIVPFYISGLWGSFFSYSPRSFRSRKQLVVVVIGKPFNSPPTLFQLRLTLQNLSQTACRLTTINEIKKVKE